MVKRLGRALSDRRFIYWAVLIGVSLHAVFGERREHDGIVALGAFLLALHTFSLAYDAHQLAEKAYEHSKTRAPSRETALEEGRKLIEEMKRRGML